MCLIPTRHYSRHLYLSGMWLGVDLRMDTRKTSVSKRLDCLLKNMLPIIGSIVNVVGGTYMTT
jgi:hypothetical protein